MTSRPISLWLRASYCIVLSLGLMLAVTSPASARDQTVRWNNDAATIGGGHGAARVTVRFPTKRFVEIRGFVDDVCPADGKATHLKIYLNTQAPAYRLATITHERGCEAKVRSFTRRLRIGDTPTGTLGPLERVIFALCTVNPDSGSGSCENRTVDNPQVSD